MTRTEADVAAQAARDAANDAGALAWSPSRAREALRQWSRTFVDKRSAGTAAVHEAWLTLEAAEDHLGSAARFDAFCLAEIGYNPL